MAVAAAVEDPMLHSVHELAQALEKGEEAEAGRLLDRLTGMRDSRLYQELGGLTRQLHEALNTFELDSRLAGMAETHIPDAKQRLDYVITKTDESAHRTLNAVEAAIPISDALGQRAEALDARWQRFERREMGVKEFRALAGELRAFFDTVRDDTTAIHSHLSDVLMAQDFQDLTGQVIRRVIELVQDVEDNLVELVRMRGHNGAGHVSEQKTAPEGKPSSTRAEGPQVSAAAPGVVSGQDEVDELLSSLGF